MDSDNNNTDNEEAPVEDIQLEVGINNTREEDKLIAKTIIDGFPTSLEYKPKRDIKKLKKRFRIQLIMESDLRKLCLMRCFKPSRVIHEIKNFVVKFLGSFYNDPPLTDWTRILKKTKKTQPNLLMLGPNMNPYDEFKTAK